MQGETRGSHARDPGGVALQVGQRGLWITLAAMPFQLAVVRLVPAGASRLVGGLDEVALVVLGGLALWVRATDRRRAPIGEAHLVISAVVFALVCALSTVSAGSGPLFFVLGTADYLKVFAFAWIAAVLADERLATRVLQLIRWITLAAVAWTAVEFVLAMLLWINGAAPDRVRLGLYRPNGPFGHINLLGFYCLMAMVLELCADDRRHWRAATAWLGTALTLSRMAAGAVVLTGALLVRRAKWLLGPIALGVVLIGFTSETTVAELQDTAWNYRAEARQLGLEVFREHPLLGAGPGRFGGAVAHALDSPVHQAHPFSPRGQEFFDMFRSLDSFYPRLAAELGVIGSASFAAMCLMVLGLLWRKWRRTGDFWAHAGLVIVVSLPVYWTGAGLNQAPVTVSLATVVGIALAGARCSPE